MIHITLRNVTTGEETNFSESVASMVARSEDRGETIDAIFLKRVDGSEWVPFTPDLKPKGHTATS